MNPMTTAAVFLALSAGAPQLAAATDVIGPNEVPSFLQRNDVFCSSEADFDDYVKNGHVRPNSAIQTCQLIRIPTRVAVMSGQGGVKSMVRVISGPLAFEIGWTNGQLPLAK
jgi:hypothetical protein